MSRSLSRSLATEARSAVSFSNQSIKLGLERVYRLLEKLDSPHLATPIVHIAGTNGKGSVSAYIDSILRDAKHRVGRFNSPFFLEPRDGIMLDGHIIDTDLYVQLRKEVEAAAAAYVPEASPFEMDTSVAFLAFARSGMDIAVVECGLGGATDATNVVPDDCTLISVLTSISLDHDAFLGSTVELITANKSRISKAPGGADLVVSEQEGFSADTHAADQDRTIGCDLQRLTSAENAISILKCIRKTARDTGSSLFVASKGTWTSGTLSGGAKFYLQPLVVDKTALKGKSGLNDDSPLVFAQRQSDDTMICQLPLRGDVQLYNASLAISTVHRLRSSGHSLKLVPSLSYLTNANIRNGIQNTKWRGRLDHLEVHSGDHTARLLVDGAHNYASSLALAAYLKELPKEQQPTTLITALSNGREPDVLDPVISALTELEKIICVPFTLPENMPWIKTSDPDSMRDYLKNHLSNMLLATDREAEDITILSSSSFKEALQHISNPTRVTLVAGSLYLAADAYRLEL